MLYFSISLINPLATVNARVLNKMLTDKQLSGRSLEMPIAHFLVNCLHLGDRVQHNDFNPSNYPNSKALVVDSTVDNDTLIEATNPKQTTFYEDSILLEKIDYFNRVDSTRKRKRYLVISHNNFSQNIANKLTEEKIQLVTLGLTATQQNFNEIVKRLYHTVLYHLGFKSKPKLTLPTQADPNSVVNNTLDNYLDYQHTKKNTYTELIDNELTKLIEDALNYWCWVSDLAEHGVRWAKDELQTIN